MKPRGSPGIRRALLLLATCLVACGSPSGPDPRDRGSEGPEPGRSAAPPAGAASTAPSPAVTVAAPPQPARIAARAAPSIEACIEQNIHDKEFDGLAPRDARRKLRRLQVKADCESRLAAR